MEGDEVGYGSRGSPETCSCSLPQALSLCFLLAWFFVECFSSLAQYSRKFCHFLLLLVPGLRLALRLSILLSIQRLNLAQPIHNAPSDQRRSFPGWNLYSDIRTAALKVAHSSRLRLASVVWHRWEPHPTKSTDPSHGSACLP